MNGLMAIATGNNDLSMDSSQVAVLLEKRHDNVKRTIRMLVKQEVIQLPQTEVVKNHQGQTASNYVFHGEQGRIDSIIVVAQMSPKFTGALVKRWDELEKQVNGIKTIPQTYAEALQLAASQALKIEEDKPKVDFYDAIGDCSYLMTVTQVAKKLGWSAITLNKHLVNCGTYDRRFLPKKLFSQDFLNKGYGVMKSTDKGFDRNLITQKGQQYIVDLFNTRNKLRVM